MSGAKPLEAPSASSGTDLLSEVVTTLEAATGRGPLEVSDFCATPCVRLDAGSIVAACRSLRDAPALDFALLVDLTAVDWSGCRPGYEPRFDVIYQLMSLTRNERLFLAVGVPSDDAVVPSVTGLWRAAGFLEREVFDLMGIRFDGHPDLRRLVLPEDWQGHPLRKEYPLRGDNRP